MKQWLCIGEFDDRMLKSFMKFYNSLNDSCDKEVIIYIDSTGGEVHTFNSIASLIENSKIKFHTCAIGDAMSCGLDLLVIGHTRYGTTRAEYMFHDISSEVTGKTKQMKEELELTEKSAKKFLKSFAKKTNKSAKWWAEQADKRETKDFYFDSSKALCWGVIDRIGLPKQQPKSGGKVVKRGVR